MKDQATKIRAFPSIPSQEDLDLRHSLRTRVPTRGERFRAGMSVVLGALHSVPPVSLTLTMGASREHAPAERSKARRADPEAAARRLDDFRTALDEIGLGPVENRPVRFPYKG